MALYFVGDTLDDLPEALRPKHKIMDGKYQVPAGTDGYRPENADALRAAVSKEREGRKAAEKKLGVYGWHVDDEGNIREKAEGAIDPDVARDAIGKVKSGRLEGKDGKALEEAIREAKKEYEAKYAADKAALDVDRREIDAELVETFILREGEAAIKAAGGDDKTVKALLPILRQRAKVEKGQDGKRRAFLYDENGKQLISRKSGSADPMQLGEYVGLLRDDSVYRPNFPLTRAGGSGANHTTGGSATGGGIAGEPNGYFGEQGLARLRDRAG